MLREVLDLSKRTFIEYHNREPDYGALFRLIFRFIAAKLHADRQYPGNDWNSPEPQTVIRAVDEFYFQNTEAEPILTDERVQRAAWRHIQSAFHLQNLSVEALAFIYENTLVEPETRRRYGTHATPPYIAEYAVRHLPFENLPPEERRVFEPFAGHAPFLIAALGRLRNLLPANTDAKQRHEYFVRMLSGMEIDSFAREIARYSLILADYPNPDGWRLSGGNITPVSG